ncbi:uncharacterized protein, partial [Littorina saxatilis]|uniref:uncharacterized protein n=1 Tax=Littorina saxatilis TaxID=31220 RepID=UPI0038B45776
MQMELCYLPFVFLSVFVADCVRYIDAATLNATSSPQLAVIGESSSVTVRCSYTMLPSEEFCNLSLLRFATPNSDPVELASLHADGPNRNYTFYQTSLRTDNTSSASESNTTNSINTHRSKNRTNLNTFGAQKRTWSVLSSESERFVEVEHSHTTCDDDGSVFSCVLEFRVQSEFLLREIAKNITVAVEVSTVSMSAFPNTTSIAEFTVMTFTCQCDVHSSSQGGFHWFILGGTNVTEVSNVSENDAMTLRGEFSTFADFTSSATTGILPGGLPCTKRLTSNIRMLTNHTQFGLFFEVRCFIVNSMSEATDPWNCTDRLCSSHWVSTTYRCNGGFYGFKCKKTCGHCIERRCNYESGECSACKQGYELPLCIGGSADSSKVLSDLRGLIGGGTVGFLALGMGVFLAFWNCQRPPQADDRLVETRVHSPGRRGSNPVMMLTVNPVMIRSSTSSRVRFLVDNIPESWISGSGSTHLDEISFCKIIEEPDPQQDEMDPDVQQPDLKQPDVLGASPGQPVVSEPTVQQPGVLGASVQQPGVLGTSVKELTDLGASVPKPTASRTIMKKPGRFGGSSKQPAVAETFVYQPGVFGANVNQFSVPGASVNKPGVSRAS